MLLDYWTRQVDELRKEIHHKDLALSALQHKALELDAEVLQLRAERKGVSDRLGRRHSVKVDKLRRENSEALENLRAEYTNQLAELRSKLKDQAEIAEALTKTGNERYILRERAEWDSLKNSLAAVQTEVWTLRAQRDDMQKRESAAAIDKTLAEEKVSRLSSACEELEQEVSLLKREAGLRSQEPHDSAFERVTLRQALLTAQAEVEALRKELDADTLRNERRALADANGTLKAMRIQLTNLRRKHTQTTEELAKRTGSLKHAQQKLEAMQNSAGGGRAAPDTDRAEIQALRCECDAAKKLVAERDKALSAARVELQNLRRARDCAVDERVRLEEEGDDELNRLRRRCKHEDVGMLGKALREASEQDEQRRALSHLRDELSAIQSAHASLGTEHAALQAEAEALRKFASNGGDGRAQAQQAQIDAFDEERVGFHIEVARLNAEISILREQGRQEHAGDSDLVME